MAETPRAEHAIILLIDGLSFKAPERIGMKNFQALAAAGAYWEKSYNIVPAHPKSGEWARYHSSSIPNPAILAGTLLLRPDQRWVQDSFYPRRVTAHAANDIDYRRLNVGFHLSFLHGSDEAPVDDAEVFFWAAEFLRKARPAFMKIHLQDTGRGGEMCRSEKDPAVPWRGNIWAEGSPYRGNALKADEYLGRIVEELGKLGLREKTVLFVSADHGQSDGGWHPFDDRDAWAMPLVAVGPGIKKGQRFEYAEQIDIVPTLCHLMGVKPPPNADGRILAEALTDPPAGVPPRRYTVRELNAVLVEGEALARKQPKGSAAAKDFFGFDRILHWRDFGTLEKLLAHDREAVEAMRAGRRKPGSPR
ncbi:MAG: sulfatase-like hydrolase/transferase [Bryobacterales bacterium]|nr:sulfatase-like hydrolase/transferase [Bryobacterales bacterium]